MRACKLGRGAAVVGAGRSKFGAFRTKTTRDLSVEAFCEGEARRTYLAFEVQA